jgi:hypothetical protein
MKPERLISFWAALGEDLLFSSTGVLWTSETKIERWDAQIIFKHEDITRMTQSLNMNRPQENNFYLLLCTILEIASLWRRQHD